MKPKPKLVTKRLAHLVVVVVCLLAIANLVASNTVATTGKDLKQFQLEAQTLEAENQKLHREISQKTSLQTIASKAENLDLSPVTQTLNLTALEPLALSAQAGQAQ